MMQRFIPKRNQLHQSVVTQQRTPAAVHLNIQTVAQKEAALERKSRQMNEQFYN